MSEATVQSKARLTLELSGMLNRKLEAIADEEGITKTDVLRKAIAFFDVAHQAAKNGKKVGVVGDDERLEKEFVGL